MKRSRPLGWILLAGVVLLAVGALMVTLGGLRRPEAAAKGITGDVLVPLADTGKGPLGQRAAKGTTRRSLDLIEPLGEVTSTQGTGGAPLESTEAPQEIGLPRPGVLRIVGTVTDSQGRPVGVPGARVRVTQERAFDGSRVALGDVVVSSRGRFQCEVDLSAASKRRGDFRCTLRADGRGSGERFAYLEDAQDGVLDASFEVESETHGVQARGRIVDVEGRPVSDAVVRYVLWQQLGDYRTHGDQRSDSEGWFTLSLEGRGWLTALASAPDEGAAKLAVDVDPAGTLTDLGVLVLQPVSILSGLLVGPSGRPIPGLAVEAGGFGAEDDEWASVRTGADGQFRFHTLRPGKYRLKPDFALIEWEEALSYSTGTTGIRLVLERPIVKVRAHGERGTPVPADQIRLHWAGADGLPEIGGKGAGRWITQEVLGDGSVFYVLSEPGRCIASARDFLGEYVLTGSRTLDVGLEQLDLEVQLEKLKTRPLTIRMVAPGVERTGYWSVTFQDMVTGAALGGANGVHTTAQLPATRVLARVKPSRTSYWFPFEATIDLTKESPEEWLLTAPRVGGKVAVSGIVSAEKPPTLKLTIYGEGKKFPIGRDNLRADGTQRTLPHRLTAGDYVVFGRLKGDELHSDRVAEHRFTVRPGELTRVELTFP